MKKWHRTAGAGLLVATMLIGGTAQAKPDAVYEEIQAAIEAVGERVTGVGLQVDALADAVDAQADRSLRVQVDVDPAACAAGTTGCTTSFSTEPAAHGNGQPVRVVFQVTHRGEPVSGLGPERIQIRNSFVPAGAASIKLCEPELCTENHFFAGLNGMYMAWIIPVGNLPWKGGRYVGTVRVTDAQGQRGWGLMSYSIPKTP